MKKFILNIGEWFFRYRDYTPIPLILLLIYIGEFNLIYTVIGVIFIILGESIRIISVAFIGGISRTRKGSVSRLVTDGPFSCARNPLYIGNFILSLGLSCLSGVWWFLIVYLVMFVVQYYPIIKWEENLLENKFGEEYLEYKKSVPCFFPKLRCSFFSGDFNYKKALKSERSTLTTVITLCIIMGVKFFAWQNILNWWNK